MTDPTSWSIFVSALLTVAYACYRAHLTHTAAKSHRRVQEAVATLQGWQAWLFPVIGSIVLIVLFWFIASLQLIVVVAISIYATFSIAFAFSPLLERLVTQVQWTTMLGGLFSKSQLVLLPFALFMVGYWFYTGSWIANNIMGISLCVTYVSFLKLPNLKIAVILLGGLFIYDVFWVFYSKPVFGKNVMVEVAKSVDAPVKLMYPKKSSSGQVGFSMLGLGDLALPAMLLSLALRFDYYKYLRVPNNGYFVCGMVGYACGIVVTLTMVSVFHAAQPALLYLVPGTVVPLAVMAYLRNDLHVLWNGIPESEEEQKETSEEEEKV